LVVRGAKSSPFKIQRKGRGSFHDVTIANWSTRGEKRRGGRPPDLGWNCNSKSAEVEAQNWSEREGKPLKVQVKKPTAREGVGSVFTQCEAGERATRTMATNSQRCKKRGLGGRGTREKNAGDPRGKKKGSEPPSLRCRIRLHKRELHLYAKRTRKGREEVTEIGRKCFVKGGKVLKEDQEGVPSVERERSVQLGGKEGGYRCRVMRGITRGVIRKKRDINREDGFQVRKLNLFSGDRKRNAQNGK